MRRSRSRTVAAAAAAGRATTTTAGDGDAPLPPPCFGRVGDDVDDVAGLSGRGRFPGDKKGEDDDEEGGGGIAPLLRSSHSLWSKECILLSLVNKI